MRITWWNLSILSILIINCLWRMTNTSTELEVREMRPKRKEVYLPHPKYQVYKFTKYLTLKDYVQIHKIFLDKKHLSVFTCILDGTRTIQLMMRHGSFVYMTTYGYLMMPTKIYTEPGMVLFQIPELGFALKFRVSERVEMHVDGEKHTNVVCICRYYFN